MGSKHVVKGFSKATEQMMEYDPTKIDGDEPGGDEDNELRNVSEKEERKARKSERVAPLMQFFELVHIGDMIQSMVQVYFDKEVVSVLAFKNSSITLPCPRVTYSSVRPDISTVRTS